jgi:hypothetical protein
MKIDVGQIILGVVIWIDVAHDKNKWRVLVNAAMNLLVP